MIDMSPRAMTQIRESVDQPNDGFLRFGPRQMRTQTQVPATTKRLMMGVTSSDIESPWLRINRWIVIGRSE